MAGWIKLSRDLVYHDLWQETPFSRGQAWVDLILLANHKAGFIRVAGEKIKIERGQCGWSQLRLSKRWGWSRGKVRRFLSDLKTEHMIDTEQNNRNTIISICNYDKFQSSNNNDSTTDDTPDSTTDGHQTVQQTDTNKNVKKDKNDKEVKQTPLAMLVGMGVEKGIAQEWLKVRRTKRLASTKTAFEKVEKEADKAGMTMNAAITKSVQESWAGFKASWVKDELPQTSDYMRGMQ